MRELKFRQFVNGRWHYFGFVDNTFIGPIAPDVEHNPVGQYTGLRDKNGKEIYEGDIVKHWRGIGEVIFDQNIAGFNVKGYYDQSADYPTIAFAEGIFEVVGSIFENPELVGDTA